jgi:peptidoglycan/LPS O-acetylase OafA/YrhL
MKHKRIMIILLSVAVLLLIPFIAMQWTDEVHWTLFDFMVAGVLLFSTGLLCELVLRKIKKTTYRAVIIVVLLIAFLLLWAELAVGIFGTPIGGH